MKMEVAKKVAGGLSIFCATCRAHWDGEAWGTPCAERRPCGSPLVGLAFPHYRPISGISREALRGFCFICGGVPAGAVRAEGTQDHFGVCDTHRARLKDFKPTGGAAGGLLVHHDGTFVPASQVVLRPRTLSEEISHNCQVLGDE